MCGVDLTGRMLMLQTQEAERTQWNRCAAAAKKQNKKTTLHTSISLAFPLFNIEIMFHSLREMRDRSRAEERFWKILSNQLIDLKNEKKWKHLDRRADLLCSAYLLPPLLWHRPSPCPHTSSTFGDEDFLFLEISPPDSVLGIFSEPHLLWIIPFWKESNRVSDWVFFFLFFLFFSPTCV